MTVNLNAVEMEGTAKLSVSCSPASSQCKFHWGDDSIGEHEQIVSGAPNGKTTFELLVTLPSDKQQYVKATCFDDEEQVYVTDGEWLFKTSEESKFGGGKLLDQ